jgi:hypothetical protein
LIGSQLKKTGNLVQNPDEEELSNNGTNGTLNTFLGVRKLGLSSLKIFFKTLNSYFYNILEQWSQTRGPQDSPMRPANIGKNGDFKMKHWANWSIFSKTLDINSKKISSFFNAAHQTLLSVSCGPRDTLSLRSLS